MTNREITEGQQGDLEIVLNELSAAVSNVLNAERMSRHQVLKHLMTASEIVGNVVDSLPPREL